MADIDRTIEWRAGAGTPIKYQVRVRGHAELGEIVETPSGKVGTLYYDFDVTVTTHPYNSQNSFSAADFAVLSVGDLNPRVNYPLPDGRSLYGEPMLCPTNLPTSQVLFEFRGATYRTAGPNRTSFWANGSTQLDNNTTEGDWTYHLIGTNSVDITGAQDQPIITWTTSGAGANHTEWLTQEVWSQYIDFDKDYTLHFDAGNGSGAPADMTYRGPEDTHTFTIPNTTPSRKHWLFKGWTNNGTTYQPGGTITVSPGTTTLTAIWEYTYRPGQMMVGGVWFSHDRDTNIQDGKYMTQVGHADIRVNGSWVEMRTRRNIAGLTDPPVIRRSNAWVSQALIGQGGEEHDVGY